MGVNLRTDRGKAEFDMGYINFGFFRILVANRVDRELGRLYGDHYFERDKWIRDELTIKIAARLRRLFEERRIAPGIAAFLDSADQAGKVDPLTARRIYGLIKDVRDDKIHGFGGKTFEDLKEFFRKAVELDCGIRWS